MKLYLIIYLLLSLFASSLFSQDISKLKKNKTSILEKIEAANVLLKKYDKKKGLSVQKIKVLNKQLSEREELILLMNKEIHTLEIQIDSLSDLIVRNEQELKELKKDYAAIILKTFKNRSVYNELTFLLGAESFNDAYRRYIMMNEYSKFRRNQGELIQTFTDKLNQQKSQIQEKRMVQETILSDVILEKENINQSKTKIAKDVKSLKKKEKAIKAQIKKQQKALKKLENDIVRLINASRSQAVEYSTFSEAKGKLIWPTEGLIISKFGEHQHPVLKYVKVNNNGVDIKYTTKPLVVSVYKGKVSRVVSIPGYNNAVIVRHGKYLTVYANLKSVNVSAGEEVSTHTLIGQIFEGEGDNSGVLHFEVWKENEKMNPQLWLKK